ncbi:MAG: hypothetical protein J7539_11125 [Niabella sp.]|nr:hypothetical protein [Niabella sp.]
MKNSSNWFFVTAVLAMVIYLTDLLMNQQKILLHHESPGGYAVAGFLIILFLFILWLYIKKRYSKKQ